ncbi:MAG: HAD-IA family hydrolase [Desulfobacteraceae bacterium]|nr:HAD-IA family hydrolase [Desulfobacteraceae bacterium]
MAIVFDLDGTLSDPLTGVAASLNYALDRLDMERKDESDLKKYIGPPLPDIFSDLLATKDEIRINQAISFFRERYFKVGYRENLLYPGISDLLKSLWEGGFRLYIATAKKETTAEAVADYFSISHFFTGISGCGLKKKKIDLLNDIRRRENGNPLTMIGDRYLDMEAGKAAHCRCIGVLWGYGGRKELLDAGADALCNSPMALNRMLLEKYQSDGPPG